ncbi:MAG: glycosyltransferase, partial [Planctomycetia bacterium]|nr:glycosyltransferase [Planctomycetia bacterium]
WLPGDVVPGGDDVYPGTLKELAVELGVADNVFLLGWRDDLPRVIQEANIVALPTHTEGFGRCILEGMILHRPVVATPVGGIMDQITDGETGLLFPVGDDKKLSAHLKRLTVDADYAARLAEKANRMVRQRFTPQLHTERVLHALKCAAGQDDM